MDSGLELAKAYVQIIPTTEGIQGELSKAMSSAASSAGDDAGKVSGSSFSGAFSGVLKGVAGITTAVTTAIAGATAAVISASGEVAAYGDEIDKNSQKMGVSSKFYQEWDAVLQHSGTSMGSMSATFKKLATASQNATDAQKEAFEALGMSMQDVQSMSAEDLFKNVVAGLQDMEEGTERTALATELLGKGAMELGPLLNTSAEDTQAMIDTVNELGGVMSEEAVKAAAGYQDALQDMTTAMSGLKNNMIAEFLPGMTEVMNGLAGFIAGDEGSLDAVSNGINDLLNNVSDMFPQFIELAMSIITGIADAIITNLPSLMETGTQIIIELAKYVIEALPNLIESAFQVVITIAQGIIQALPELLPTIIDVIKQIALFLIDNIPLLIDAALELMLGLADGLVKAIPDLIKAIPEIISSLLDALLSSIPKLIEAGIQLLVALVEDLPTIISAIVEALPQIIDAILTAIMDSLPLIIDAGVKLFIALIENLPTIIITIVKAIPQIITGIVNAFKNAWPQIKQSGQNLITQLGTGIIAMKSALQTKVSEIKNSLVSWFKELPGKIKEVGGDLITGLWEGLNDKIGWLKEKIASFTESVLDDIKGFFKINSPSKETEWIGEMLDLGLANGISDYAKDVIDEATQMSNEVLGAFKSINTDIDSGLATVSNIEVGQRGNEIDQLYNLLAKYLPYIADRPIVLDSGALVGGTVKKMNKALGILAEKGVYA